MDKQFESLSRLLGDSTATVLSNFRPAKIDKSAKTCINLISPLVRTALNDASFLHGPLENGYTRREHSPAIKVVRQHIIGGKTYRSTYIIHPIALTPFSIVEIVLEWHGRSDGTNLHSVTDLWQLSWTNWQHVDCAVTKKLPVDGDEDAVVRFYPKAANLSSYLLDSSPCTSVSLWTPCDAARVEYPEYRGFHPSVGDYIVDVQSISSEVCS